MIVYLENNQICLFLCLYLFFYSICSLFAEDANKEGDLYIRSVCFSPDNKYLAAGAEDKTVKVLVITISYIYMYTLLACYLLVHLFVCLAFLLYYIIRFGILNINAFAIRLLATNWISILLIFHATET